MCSQGVVVGLGGIGGSPEHEYEKLNYELMVVDTSKKLMVVDNSKKTDPRLNSLGRCSCHLTLKSISSFFQGLQAGQH